MSGLVVLKKHRSEGTRKRILLYFSSSPESAEVVKHQSNRATSERDKRMQLYQSLLSHSPLDDFHILIGPT